MLDVGWLGVGDAYIDVATTVMTLGGDLNPQYGGAAAVERVLRRVGADLADPRIADYLAFYREASPDRRPEARHEPGFSGAACGAQSGC